MKRQRSHRVGRFTKVFCFWCILNVAVGGGNALGQEIFPCPAGFCKLVDDDEGGGKTWIGLLIFLPIILASLAGGCDRPAPQGSSSGRQA